MSGAERAGWKDDAAVAAEALCRHLNAKPDGCICERYAAPAACFAHTFRPEGEVVVAALAANHRLIASPMPSAADPR